MEIGSVMLWILVGGCSFACLGFLVDCIYVRKCGTLSRTDLYAIDTVTNTPIVDKKEEYKNVEIGSDKINLNF